MWKRKKPLGRIGAVAVQTAADPPILSAMQRYVPLDAGELRLYRQLREAVPLIDAALDKLVRLTGKFHITCADRAVQAALNAFLHTVPVGAGNAGITAFTGVYLNQLLTYGNAVGEAVVQNGELRALYNASLRDVELRVKSPLEIAVCRREAGRSVPVRYPELVFHTALNPEPGSARGTSLLRGLSFVSDVLIQIFHTIGVNWERVGDVRFAVTCKPEEEDRMFAQEHARQMAEEWSRAMRPGQKNDFVAVGDVQIRAIGADNQILESEVPVRQMLEQIVAKLGIPPFLLGLSWSSTERMSSQQSDILTSELEAYRRLLNPVIDRICKLWMQLHGGEQPFSIVWNDITLQDRTELAQAALSDARTQLARAQAAQIAKQAEEEP